MLSWHYHGFGIQWHLYLLFDTLIKFPYLNYTIYLR
nr:MAG TPA: hypothetical protein [Bacteriophage sp.]